VEGTAFGRYRLLELLGRGGMGEVWRAHDTVIDRIVAVKVLPAHLAQDEMFLQRFRREAHAAARLNNPHVIPIHNSGEIDGRLYVDMRLIEGRDLETVLADGPLEPARAVRIIEQVARALHAAHKVGLVHRDVKPSNILLDEDDFAYLIDFGIARGADETRLTGTGQVIGSWQYMAPERLDAGRIDARSDIYALACVLYECLTGTPPYPGDQVEQLVTAHLTAAPPRPSSADPNVPVGFDTVIATGMAKKPEHRYETPVDFARAAADAITTPILRSAPVPQPQPATQPAPVPVIQPGWGTGTPPPPPAAGVSTSAVTQLRPHEVAPPPRSSTPRRRWRRKSFVIPAAIVMVTVTAASVSLAVLRSSAPPVATAVPLPFTDLDTPWGIAVDTKGIVYVTDSHFGDTAQDRVLKLPAGSNTQSVLPFSPLGPQGVAVDTEGNVYVTDLDGRVLKLASGSSAQTVLPFTGLKDPRDVAVDTEGSVYVTDFDQNQVLKLASGSSAQTVLPFADLKGPRGVALDAEGAVYVADSGQDRVLVLGVGANTQTVLPFTGITDPRGVAVDTEGNVYLASAGGLAKLPAGSTRQAELPLEADVGGLSDVTVDTHRNLYIVSSSRGRALKLPAGSS
jgi:serine/threonine protein kinase, bacterial